MPLNYHQRLDRLDKFIAEDRLLRSQWTGKHKGKETACLLAALSPEVGAKEDPAACPANVMPLWLANLTPAMDDSGTTEAWPAMVRRYAAVARRWHVLTADDWTSLDFQSRAIAVRFAMSKTDDAKVLGVSENVCVLLDRAARLEPVADSEWAAASAAAWDAARAAAWDAARAAAWAAAWDAAWDAASAAAWAAARAAASAAAWDAAWDAASAAAWDALTDKILGAIEARCALLEAA